MSSADRLREMQMKGEGGGSKKSVLCTCPLNKNGECTQLVYYVTECNYECAEITSDNREFLSES